MFAVKRLLEWLGQTKPVSTVSLRPHRTVDLAIPYEEAFARTLEAIELTLGANVYERDEPNGLIEAGFGLVNNERVRCTFERGERSTTVHIEAQFRAGMQVAEKSAAVGALADALEAGVLP